MLITIRGIIVKQKHILISKFSFKTPPKSDSRGSGASNFIGSDQKVAPYQLVVFLGNYTKN